MALVTTAGVTLVTQGGLQIVPQAAAPQTQWPDQTTLELLRVRIGLQANDATRDAEIIAAFNAATQLAEAYLDRFIVPGSYTEVFTHVVRNTVSLKGYPLTTLPVIASDVAVPFHVDENNGLVHADNRIVSHTLKVEYECEPPKALLVALLIIFDDMWGKMTSTGGAVAGGGAIKEIRSNGASVSFDTSSNSGASGVDQDSGLPSAAASLLNVFRRKYA